MDTAPVNPFGSLDAARLAKASPRRIAAEFESILLTQMLNTMQSTVEKSGLLDGGPAEESYREMLNQAVAAEIARRGGLGLAEQIAHQIRSKATAPAKTDLQE